MSELLPATGHYDVLNVIVLKQMAGAGAVAEAPGLGVAELESTFADLSGSGLIVVFDGNALPGEGAVDALTHVAARRYEKLRVDQEILDEVDVFEDTNTQLLTVMTQWQTVDVGGTQVPNDHSDAEYDEKIIKRVERLVRKLEPLLAQLDVYDSRFGLYSKRFEAALEHVYSGQPEYVSSPLHDSVHTVWFEFHEDLLRTLGRQRVQ